MPKKPRLFVVNGETGEQHEYIAENTVDLEQSIECIDQHFKWMARARKNVNKARQAEHIRLMQAKAAEYVEVDGFQGSYSAVFLLMLGVAKYGGRIPLSRAQIGEKLKYSRQTVSRAVSHLMRNEMIFEALHDGRDYYFIAAPAGQKGRTELAGTDVAVARVKRLLPNGKTMQLLQGGVK